ncbi:MAG: leucine--tRNA ligase [Betaproteobacteria bacterium]|jgi:leucyl-tRNA synthetase|nr:leucine--tRNA ligase [Pseudomonadota bacterium]NBO04212.1 leucine--tRNA ligase [Betaproteobacteria bacterium]NBO95377.1 leucine--tRNA ligase [Betaproteobacteria bacterium]NBP37282.1 leucine--tRNA ligase [Betaproteobacteria bacterium]NBQ77673.1 leucine--tRNA ligase [Betaproteobacteria bacterium]
MFSDRYDAHAIESQVQTDWQSRDVYRVTEHNPKYPRGKYYACSMLPYPSGKLHMGHVRNYTINDVMARQLRMAGFNVLMPMGWDAFGLPAENAAMANKLAPARWTWDNIASMKAQMQAMGLAIDWSREVATCSPDYYRWNQWLFLQMLHRGIAYLKTGTVNWDPVDQTVLANEQVIDGRGWRSGALVEKREIPMYYLRITQYAEELIQDLEPLGWPERVKVMQRNWIGKSVGLRFAFPHQIEDEKGQWVQDGRLYVFTTRADTIMGVSFVAVAPEHPLAAEAARRRPALQAFIDDCLQGGVAEADLASREKDGRDTGLCVSHPITGEPIPVWIGNYVLMSYGDGAVMGVPAHDERDFAFARRFSLPIKQVIAIDGEHFDETQWQSWYENKQQGHCIDSGRYNGLNHDQAIDAIAGDLESRGLGTRQTQYRLRDWGISRQRYWGTPIPVIHCEDCGVVPVPESDLPVVLPEDLIPDGSGNPLNKHHSFLICQCPRCEKPARRETDTMDTFIDSAWYYMRYCSPDASESMVDARNDYWMPMDQYIGGIEHAVLHLLYARFWTKVMRDLDLGAPDGRGLVTCSEPFSNLLTQGMVLNETFFREDEAGRKTWFNPADVDIHLDERGRPIGALSRLDQQAVQLGGVEKMSKSKNNGVDPQHLIDRYGADTARLFTMFASPPEQSLEWSDAGVEGAHRYLRRVWASCMQALQKQQIEPALNVADQVLNTASADLRREMHQLLKQADFDYQRRQYNTVVSACMKMLNTLEAAPDTVSAAARSEGFSMLLRVLYPVVPHIAVALWQAMGFEAVAGDLLDAPWPEVDEQALVKQTVSLVLQINGKLRGSLELPADASHPMIEASARQWIEEHDAIARFAPGQSVRKLIVVPGRLVNAVTG